VAAAVEKGASCGQRVFGLEVMKAVVVINPAFTASIFYKMVDFWMHSRNRKGPTLNWFTAPR
jgi:hypothetical protein